jgi:hypothetical protein
MEKENITGEEVNLMETSSKAETYKIYKNKKK